MPKALDLGETLLDLTFAMLPVPGLTLLADTGLLSVGDTVRPCTGLLAPGDILGVVPGSAGSTWIPDRLARMLATSCLSVGIPVFDLPDGRTRPAEELLSLPIRTSSLSGLILALLPPSLGCGEGSWTCSPAGWVTPSLGPAAGLGLD